MPQPPGDLPRLALHHFALTMLGIIVCLARWPQFGRPRELPAEPAADFGKHVSALGELPRLTLHNFALTMLGIMLIDRADLEAVSEAAATRNRWEFMLSVAPLPIPYGTGSPVNPLAMF